MQLAQLRDEFRKSKEGDLVLGYDNRVYRVAGKFDSTIVNLTTSASLMMAPVRLSLYPYDKRLALTLERVVPPTDPDYPALAARFVQQPDPRDVMKH